MCLRVTDIVSQRGEYIFTSLIPAEFISTGEYLLARSDVTSSRHLLAVQPRSSCLVVKPKIERAKSICRYLREIYTCPEDNFRNRKIIFVHFQK